jgi:toxin ParE1/3/4
MRQATILPLAQAGIDETAAYIAGDNVGAGLRFLSAFGEACERLLKLPQLGRVFLAPGPRGFEIRCYPMHRFANWLIFYRPADDGIEVIRVLHGARDVDALLADEITGGPPTEPTQE